MKLPRLHIRDLFWLVLVVALGCGWWVDRHAMDREKLEVIFAYSRTIRKMEAAYHQQEAELIRSKQRIIMLEAGTTSTSK